MRIEKSISTEKPLRMEPDEIIHHFGRKDSLDHVRLALAKENSSQNSISEAESFLLILSLEKRGIISFNTKGAKMGTKNDPTPIIKIKRFFCIALVFILIVIGFVFSLSLLQIYVNYKNPEDDTNIKNKTISLVDSVFCKTSETSESCIKQREVMKKILDEAGLN